MKAILVIEVGDNINYQKDFAKIRLFTSNGRGISYYNKVKLKPMPRKNYKKFYFGNIDENRFVYGWNECIDEILGEENENNK